jgi:hypothetical protein
VSYIWYSLTTAVNYTTWQEGGSRAGKRTYLGA